MEMTPEDKKRLRGFMFLSEKPILYVLNVNESTQLGKELEEAVSQVQPDRSRRRGPMLAQPRSAEKWKRNWPR